jgi:hypothetical protein
MGRLSLFGDPGSPWSLGPNLVVPEFVFTFGPQSLASNLLFGFSTRLFQIGD